MPTGQNRLYSKAFGDASSKLDINSEELSLFCFHRKRRHVAAVHCDYDLAVFFDSSDVGRGIRKNG